MLALGTALVAAVAAPFRQRDAAPAGAAAGCAAALLVFCVTAGVDWMWESTAVTARRHRLRGPRACVRLVVAAAQRRVLPRVARRLARAASRSRCRRRLCSRLPRSVPARTRFASGEATTPCVAATDAVQTEPWSTLGVSQRALVLEELGFLDAAAEDARRATELEPTNSEAWLILARIEVERQHAPARRSPPPTRARELNPRNPVFTAADGS